MAHWFLDQLKINAAEKSFNISGDDRRRCRVRMARHHPPDPDTPTDDRPRLLAQPGVSVIKLFLLPLTKRPKNLLANQICLSQAFPERPQPYLNTTSFGLKSVDQMSWLKVSCSHPFP
jgi:hypothetical protein